MVLKLTVQLSPKAARCAQASTDITLAASVRSSFVFSVLALCCSHKKRSSEGLMRTSCVCEHGAVSVHVQILFSAYPWKTKCWVLLFLFFSSMLKEVKEGKKYSKLILTLSRWTLLEDLLIMKYVYLGLLKIIIIFTLVERWHETLPDHICLNVSNTFCNLHISNTHPVGRATLNLLVSCYRQLLDRNYNCFF